MDILVKKKSPYFNISPLVIYAGRYCAPSPRAYKNVGLCAHDRNQRLLYTFSVSAGLASVLPQGRRIVMRLILFGASLLYCSFLSASEYPDRKPPISLGVRIENAAQGGAFGALSSLAPVAAGAPAPAPSRAALPDPGLSGEELFQALHAAVPKRDIPYSSAKAYMYSKADNVICNGAPGIITFYSRICVNGASANGNDYPELTDLNGDGVVDKIVNAEHIWPQSYFKSALPMVSDLFNLGATFATPNSRRGNSRFAVVSNPAYSTSCGSKSGKEGFEPCDPTKGNVARSVLYFVLAYHDRSIRQGMDYNEFWVKQVPMFLEWSRQDPPDAAEKLRNDLVEQFQGNRNPFIDNPALADRIGAQIFASH